MRVQLGSTIDQLSWAERRHKDEMEVMRGACQEQIRENDALYEEVRGLTEKIEVFQRQRMMRIEEYEESNSGLVEQLRQADIRNEALTHALVGHTNTRMHTDTNTHMHTHKHTQKPVCMLFNTWMLALEDREEYDV